MVKIISIKTTEKKNLEKFVVEYNGKKYKGFVPKALYSKIKEIVPNKDANEDFYLNIYLNLFKIKPDNEYNLWIPDLFDVLGEYLFDIETKEKNPNENENT